MSSNIPTRRTVRVPRPANDENAPALTRLGAATRHAKAASIDIAKNNVLASKETLKPALSTGTATARARPALAQQRANTNTTAVVAGKRKRDALGDATNGKGKTAASTLLTKAAAASAVDKPSSTATSSTTTRASSVSTQTKENTARATKENPTRVRSALAVKPKNVNAAPVAKDELKGAKTEENATGRAVARRPLGAKSSQTTTTTVTNVNVVKSRKVISAVEKKTRVERVAKIELKVEETDEEDAARVHKRPRLSEIEEVQVKELETITVEKVQEVLEKTLVKPEDEQPDDLDKDDMDDPLMVAEYVVEIFDYLYELEKTTMPNPKYMNYQKDLKPHMRGILGEWLIGIHRGMRMVPETLFIAMNLVDRFLSVRAISVEKVQLVGVVCLLIASKYEEICAPSIKMMLDFSAKSSTAEEIKEAEKYVLKSIKYNLSYSSPITFLRRISKADGFDAQSRTLAKYLVEIYCVEYRLVPYTPSCIAAAAMWLARLALDRGEWTANLAHYSGYKEAALLPVANIMVNYLLKPPAHQSLFEKYAAKRFEKASLFMRAWVLARWDEGWDVDLPECLEALIEDSRIRRETGRAGLVELGEVPEWS